MIISVETIIKDVEICCMFCSESQQMSRKMSWRLYHDTSDYLTSPMMHLLTTGATGQQVAASNGNVDPSN